MDVVVKLVIVEKYKGRTGTLILRNMAIPLRTSVSATSWGVDTITAPVHPTPISTDTRNKMNKCMTIHNNKLSER